MARQLPRNVDAATHILVVASTLPLPCNGNSNTYLPWGVGNVYENDIR